MKNTKVIDAIAPVFTALMIEKIQNLKTGWHKPWVSMAQGCPRNLAGRYYNGGNVFMLLLLTEYKKYQTPIYLTFKQAKDAEINVKKGEKSFPVYFWYRYAMPKDKQGKGITYEEYCRLSDEQKKKYKLVPMLKYYSVFNIDQTDMPETKPERYAKLLEEAENGPQTDGTACAEVDHMVEVGGWYCRIDLKSVDHAFYVPSADRIECPTKAQFPKGAEFYSTLLHEIAHSTGHPSRLNRDMSGFFGSPSYAREELIAEMTAALCGISFGISTMPQEENAAYLASWLRGLKEKPEYLFDILIDANKAATMIAERVNQSNDKADETAA
ncbi:ArdC family protein [Alistipes finegoldii]|uniref:ArdC family protein n=1 Tax=Alistipes finegoldii TaxID=214856 RepID=UPI00242C7522|nr:zincin-like metallopeptidase domain-containing protein [Alistipes finegoldii]